MGLNCIEIYWVCVRAKRRNVYWEHQNVLTLIYEDENNTPRKNDSFCNIICNEPDQVIRLCNIANNEYLPGYIQWVYIIPEFLDLA